MDCDFEGIERKGMDIEREGKRWGTSGKRCP